MLKVLICKHWVTKAVLGSLPLEKRYNMCIYYYYYPWQELKTVAKCICSERVNSA